MCIEYKAFAAGSTQAFLKMITDPGTDLDKLISHCFALEQRQQAWETQLSGECAKVLLKPWDRQFSRPVAT